MLALHPSIPQIAKRPATGMSILSLLDYPLGMAGEQP
jgi:hypothetical protein